MRLLVGGNKSGKRGLRAEGKVRVVIARELVGKKIEQVRLETIKNADRTQLNPFIKGNGNVGIGSKIVTGRKKGYTDTRKMDYKHEIQDKKLLLDKLEVTPNLHKMASLLKKWLLGTHQNYVSQDYLLLYLNEFAFRYNRRNSKSKRLLFCSLLKQAMSHQPLSKKICLKTSKIDVFLEDYCR